MEKGGSAKRHMRALGSAFVWLLVVGSLGWLAWCLAVACAVVAGGARNAGGLGAGGRVVVLVEVG